MTLTSTVKLTLTASQVGVNDFASPSYTLNYIKNLALADGVGANQANRLFADQRTIIASGNEDLDLAGVLLDPFGVLLTMVKVKTLVMYAAPANTNNVIFGPAASNGWLGPFGDVSDRITLKPGGLWVVTAPNAAGYGVVAGTGDLLNVANSGAGTGVTYDIFVLGTNA